ncbi:hypothetical protein LPC08_17305 [Roseomonas sp. OT10]|uniref:hypothetical protein n=1 Tax=Roseomonas cutis TaxID=2897332 RepID=UPI001E32C5BD|nr:hypothetical protein [Roseomonas sp. OT10]UFN47760.1 hypothetical protein LPC08_17305 [Roseomonas sp. OT10]
MTPPITTDFDEWMVAAHRETGDFTLLFVLLRETGRTVEPLRGAWLHVVGEETRWPDMLRLFAGAGVEWSAAVFYRAGREGLVPDAEARGRLRSLTRALYEDRSLVGEGEFFNAEGLRLRLDPT